MERLGKIGALWGTLTSEFHFVIDVDSVCTCRSISTVSGKASGGILSERYAYDTVIYAR